MQRFPHVGTWLSLVEHSLGVRGVGSSNLPVPTISFFLSLRSKPLNRDGFAQCIYAPVAAGLSA